MVDFYKGVLTIGFSINGYLPYGEEDIEQVKRILLFVEEEDLGDEDFTRVFAHWEREFGNCLFEKACELLPIETVNKLRECVPQETDEKLQVAIL